MLPKSWKPNYPADLVRIGSEGDGGYVVSKCAVERSRTLISMGLSADWEFEKEFLHYGKACVICYDGTVDRRFWALFAVKKFLRGRPHQALHYFAYRRFFGSSRAQHRKLMVGYDGFGSVSLSKILDDCAVQQEIFLKIDIEGSEYRIFDQIVQHQRRFTGLAIELHDIDLHKDRVDRFISEMHGFEIIYLAANNCSPCDGVGNPTTVEVSFTRKDCFVSSSSEEITVPLAIANDPGRPIIDLIFGS